MPTGTPLTTDAVLSAAEAVIRRHGPAKATVVDVARALGVSHTAVYKHFPTKQALREAVTRRWLDPNRDELAAVALDESLDPAQRLRSWLHRVLTSKQVKSREDPELFAAYAILAAECSGLAENHVSDLLSQLSVIVAAGIADGSFAVTNAAVAARAIYDATTRFHSLLHADEWRAPGIHDDLDAVLELLLGGLAVATRA
jgi:AcrR family transcriptional regulator